MSEPKKILCVHQGYELYGSDRSFLACVSIIRKTYPRAHITVHLPKKGPLYDALKESADRIITGHMSVLRRAYLGLPLLWEIPGLVINLWTTYQAIQSYDVIYINSPLVISYSLLGRSINKKKILHLRELEGGLTQKILRFLSWCWSGKTIANSLATQKAYHADYIVYNGIETPLYEAQEYEDHTCLHILHMGRFNAIKGQGVLVEALALLPEDVLKNIRVRMVGGYFENQSHHLRQVKNQIQRYSLEKSIEILPFSETPEEHFKWSDIVVVPSVRPESFGRVAVEAMSWRKAVIASDIGALPELIEHEKTGLLTEPGHPQALSDALLFYYNHPFHVKQHGEKGAARFDMLFNEQKHTQQFQGILNEVIG